MHVTNFVQPIISQRNNNIKSNTNNSYPQLIPLKMDTVSFGHIKPLEYNKDLFKLPQNKIIELCRTAIKEGREIGKGQEATVFAIPGYIQQYCLRISNKSAYLGDAKLNFKLDDYDRANWVVAKLNDSASILQYVPGIPLKIKPHSDTPDGIKVKKSIQGLVANNFMPRSFINAIETIEKNKSKGIVFDKEGENLLVDPMTQQITPIDYSRNFTFDPDYNPISHIYHALDVDRTPYAKKIFGKLCFSYAERLKDATPEELNLDTLSKKFYHRGFGGDPFNYFPDKNLLDKTEDFLFNEVLEAKLHGTTEEFNAKLKEFQRFTMENLIEPENEWWEYKFAKIDID